MLFETRAEMQIDFGRLAASCTFLPSGTGASGHSEVPKLVKHRAPVQANPVAEGRAACHSYRLYVSRRCCCQPAKAAAVKKGPYCGISAQVALAPRGEWKVEVDNLGKVVCHLNAQTLTSAEF